MHDNRRRSQRLVSQETLPEPSHEPRVEDRRSSGARICRARWLGSGRATARMLWLAYAQGASHREIADTVGVKSTSVKLLLFRARRKLAGLLTGAANDRETRREN